MGRGRCANPPIEATFLWLACPWHCSTSHLLKGHSKSVVKWFSGPRVADTTNMARKKQSPEEEKGPERQECGPDSSRTEKLLVRRREDGNRPQAKKKAGCGKQLGKSQLQQKGRVF